MAEPEMTASLECDFTNEDLPVLLDRLRARMAKLGSVVVAFSGGVDSSLVAAVAFEALGDRALAVTGVSPALAVGELEGARRVASAIGINHRSVHTNELARPGYRANGIDRCYHCKTELYGLLIALAGQHGYETLVSGANVDDLGDWRPGLTAASEHAVVHPLVELGIGKKLVRALARELELPSADKVASPCLASRIPHGTRVEVGVLRRIDRAEAAVGALGFREFRIRDYGGLAKIEIVESELERAFSRELRGELVEAVRAAGYTRVALDLEPFRSGTLTEGLRTGEVTEHGSRPNPEKSNSKRRNPLVEAGPV